MTEVPINQGDARQPDHIYKDNPGPIPSLFLFSFDILTVTLSNPITIPPYHFAFGS